MEARDYRNRNVPSTEVVTSKQAIPLASIRVDERIQARAAITPEVVEEYGDQMTEGATFPPLIVFQEGDRRQDQWLRARGACARAQ